MVPHLATGGTSATSSVGHTFSKSLNDKSAAWDGICVSYTVDLQ